jgi:hypothetical protein
MLVIRVWQLKALNEFLVILNKAIERGLVYEVPGPLQLGVGQVRPLLEDIADSLIMDLQCPFGPKQTRGRKLNKEVPRGRRVNDTRIEQDCVTGRLNSPSPVLGTEPQARPWLHRAPPRPAF